MATTNSSLIDFFKPARQKKYSTGELVLRGEDPSGVMRLKKGFVKVYSISDEGDRYLHILYKAGELFPLIWALQNIRRRIFYEAASDVVIAEAQKDDFLRFIKKDASAAYDVLSQLAQQFYVFADRLDNLEYKSAHERVAYRLIFLASRFGQREDKSVIIKAPLTHELISESINLARETVSREIEKMEKANLLGRKDGYIVINDIERMSKQFSEPVTLNLWGLKEQ
jgi:CRP-like cAMP-binding protein